MEPAAGFSRLNLLPREIQLIIWELAFHLVVSSHTPLLITSSSSQLSKVLGLRQAYINRPVPSEDCESPTWPRPSPSPMPRNWLIHDKNIYSSHGNGEWKIYLKSNACMERECSGVKHVRMEAGESVCLGGNVKVGEHEEESRGSRIVLSKKEGLTGLLQACRLSRMVVLEEWMALLVRRRELDVAEREHRKALSTPPCNERMGGECDERDHRKRSGEDKSEMVLDVVGKMLDELRSGVGA